jgi:phosphatidylglycerol:prolipoprotein diacylglycerol transferase
VIAAISYKPIPIFDFGPLALSLHGLFAGVGFAAGAYLMIREARRRGFDPDKIVSVLTWALVGSILGARLFTVPAHLGDPGYGLDDIVGIAGDFSILGGYAGGILVGWWRMRMLEMSVPAHMDMAAAGLAIGAVVGRIGDLAIVEHLGGPTSFALGYELKPGYDVAP